MTEDVDFNQLVRSAQSARLSEADVNATLAALGEAFGAERVLDEEGRCALTDRSGRPLALLFQAGFPGVTLTAPVIEEETIAREMLIGLLLTNASWQATGGGTFSIPEPGGPVLFSRRVMLFEHDPAALAKAIDQFGALAEAWEAEIYLHLDAMDPPEASGASATPRIPIQITHA